MIRAILITGLLLVAGCENIMGPFRPKSPARVDDPRLSIDEQQRLGRQRLALPDETRLGGPRSGAAMPGTFADR